jgi:hypothetical protein
MVDQEVADPLDGFGRGRSRSGDDNHDRCGLGPSQSTADGSGNPLKRLLRTAYYHQVCVRRGGDADST